MLIRLNKPSRLLSGLVGIFLWLVLRAASADYSPPVTLEKQFQETPAEIAQRIVPAGSDWLLPPQRIELGAYDGVLLAFHDAPGYCIWYLADVPGESRYRVLRLRDPQQGDDFFDLNIAAVFTIGPDNAEDLVMLETHQQPEIAGGEQLHRGSVYRVEAGGAVRLDGVSKHLDGIETVDTARQILRAQVQPLAEPPEGRLADYFMALPVRYLDLTARERAQIIQPESPRLMVFDRANGYLQIAGDAGFPGYSLVMFQRKEAPPVLAFKVVYPMTQFTYFLTPTQEGWQDISEDIVPGYQTELNYQLPRYGTEVEVWGQEGEARYSLEWTGREFRK